MRYINTKQITHIDIHQAIKGYMNGYGNISQYSYLPERKRSFLNEWKREGYYRDGDYESHSIPVRDIDGNNKYFVEKSFLHTYPHIKIYSGKDLIHTEYFFSIFTLQTHLTMNYPELKTHYTL